MAENSVELSVSSKEFLEGLPIREDAFELREYQVEVARSVVEKGNSLVVMPTALGKTFVAALVIAKLMQKHPEGKFLFLTPTRPLTAQQAARMKELLRVDDEDVAVITGEIPLEERRKLWSMRIICATPQITKNDVKRSITSLAFKLVVFDEVHRLVKDYAYTWIARHAPQETQFLGLTASPSADSDKIKEICGNLRVQNVEARSERDLDVAPYVQKIEVEWQFVELSRELKEIKASLEGLLLECMNDLKKLGWIAAKEVTPSVLRRIGKAELLKMRDAALGMAKRGDVAMYRVLGVVARAMNLIHAQDLLESEGVNSLKAFIENAQAKEEKSRAVRLLLKDPCFVKILERCRELSKQKFEHPKLARLKEVVADEVSKGKSVIVFAHYRSTTAQLARELNSVSGVVAKQLVGRSGDGMTQREQVALLDEFRNKGFNVLVGTSISEEGLDVPSVDLVVFYEAVPSEIRLIQRRGRTGRVRPGKVVALITKGGRDEAYWWISRRKEKAMHKQVERLKERLGEESEGSQMKVVDYAEE